MNTKTNFSVNKMWESFIAKRSEFKKVEIPAAWHFCDNKKSADELAELVVKRIKTATCSLLIDYEKENEKLPKEGQLDIIIDWAGNAQAIIKIIRIEIVPYNKVTAEFAKKEGEGDRSLDYWRKVHWRFFENRMIRYKELPTQNMPLVCEEFEVLWDKDSATNKK